MTVAVVEQVGGRKSSSFFFFFLVWVFLVQVSIPFVCQWQERITTKFLKKKGR